jgi:hypothetical protein
MLWEIHLLEMIIKSSVRKLENVLWSTFSVNSIMVIISWNLSNNSLSFKVLIEWELGNLSHILVSINNLIVNIFIIINKELNKSNFNFLASWFV